MLYHVPIFIMIQEIHNSTVSVVVVANYKNDLINYIFTLHLNNRVRED